MLSKIKSRLKSLHINHKWVYSQDFMHRNCTVCGERHEMDYDDWGYHYVPEGEASLIHKMEK